MNGQPSLGQPGVGVRVDRDTSHVLDVEDGEVALPVVKFEIQSPPDPGVAGQPEDVALLLLAIPTYQGRPAVHNHQLPAFR